MIFSRLFTPGHASKDPEVRLNALAKLSPEKPTEKAILHELAFNDSSADVTLAALEKLNSFALWQKMASIAGNERVKKLAQKRVERAIVDPGAGIVSESERIAFLLESAPAQLIETVLNHDTRLYHQTELVLALLQKAGSDSLYQHILLHTDNRALQQQLIAQSSDTDLLQRLRRKATDGELKSDLDARLTELHEQAQRPLQLQKSITLVLSKYQALLDKSDYPEIAERAGDYLADYQALMADADCLNDADRAQIEQKYRRIRDQIERHQIRVKPEWEARCRQQAVEQTVAQARQACDKAEKAVNVLYNNVSDPGDALYSEARSSLQQAESAVDELAGLAGSDTLERDYKAQLARLTTRLEHYHEQRKHAAALSDFLHGVREAVPGLLAMQDLDAIKNKLGDFDASWRVLTDAMQAVPTELKQQWREATAELKAKVKSHQQQQRQATQSVKKGLHVISSLIEQGRYRPAMAKFQDAREAFDALPATEQTYLQTLYDRVEEDVSRLAGWQSYLAQPRQPELLAQAEALVKEMPEDVAERAQAVRTLRKQWNSLKSPDESDDSGLSAQFDQALENAFAPCRAYYEQQDALRQQAFETRQSLINDAMALRDIESEETLAKQLDSLIKRWRDAGQTDVKRYQKLKEQWQAALTPLQSRVKAWQADNGRQKQALVEQAAALSEQEDLTNAAQDAKQAQQQWKAIGSAGQRRDGALWKAFRQHHDVLFARLREQKEAGEQHLKEKIGSLEQRLDAAIASVSEHTESELGDLVIALSDEVNAIRGKAKKPLLGKLDVLKKQREAQRQRRTDLARHAQYQALAALIESWLNGGENAPRLDGLPTPWRQAAEAGQPSAYSRDWLTTALEMNADSKTPADATVAPQQVKLDMLSDHLEQGVSWERDDLITHWLSHGVTEGKESVLARRFSDVVTAILTELAHA